MLTIARGQTASTGVVTVTALDDDEAGLGHDVAVLRGTPSDATPFVRVPALTTVRIFDDDATFPHIVIAPVQSSVFEGDTSTVVAALFPPSTEEVTVTIGVDEAHVDHDAEPGQYALSANRTLTVPAGSMRSTGVVTLTAADDGYYGPGWLRTVILEVASVAGADPGIRTGKLSDWHIYEDEAAPRVTLAVAPSVVAENGGRSAVTATLNTKLRNAAEISVTAVPAGPAATDGFVQTGTTLTIAADARTSTGTVTIDAVDDAVDGPDKRVVVAGTVPEPAGAVWFPLAEGLTIRDDDEPNTPPVFAGTGATRALAENVGDAATATAADIGAALPAATDADGGDTLTYGLDGADASSFGFDAANRRIRTKAGVTYDHEARSTYASLSLRVEDGNGGSAALPVAVAVTDVAEAPRAPAAPRVVPGTGSGTALSVRWTAPDNAGRPPIEDYDLRYRGGTGGGWLDGPRNVRETAATLGGLSADTSYQVQVLARNAEGQSDWSASGSGRTNADEGPADLAVLTMHARAGSVPSGGLAEWELRRSGGDMDWLKMSYRMEEADGIHTTAWGYLKPGQTKKSVSKYVYAQGTVVMRVTGPSQPRCTPSDAPSASCTDGYAVGSPSSASMRVTAPASSSPPDASVSGAVMTLRYAQALDAGSTPGPKDWVVRAATDAGARTLAVASVSVLGAEALLELKPPVVAGEEVAVSYLPWAMHPLRASEGMEAAPLTELPVRNETPPTLPFEPPADDAAVATDVADGRVAPPLGPWLSALLAERPASSLTRLDLPRRGLTDISPLAGLTGLEVLDLSGNAVADAWPLAGLSNLRRLDLSRNRIADVSALAGLTGLEVLDLSDNALEDLWPLAGLSNLRRLDLSRNRVGNLSALAGLVGLEVLVLDGSGLAEVWPLAQLPRLARLGLSGNRMADVVLLADLGSIVRLDLSGNRIGDASPLGDLSDLVWLDLSGNPVSDVSPLGRLTALRWLWLDAGAPGLGALAPLVERPLPLRIHQPAARIEAAGPH